MAFERVGSSQPIVVDVRILAATHQHLEELIQTGRFREDLYYRLNVICLHMPALRERHEDILELALCFLHAQARRTGKLVTHLEPEAVEALLGYYWPGNVRELENVLERAVVLADGPVVTLGDLPLEIQQPSRRRLRPRLAAPLKLEQPVPVPAGSAVVRSHGPARASRASRLAAGVWSGSEPEADDDEGWNAEFAAYERTRLMDALNEAKGNKSVAARLLGMPRSTFFSKLKKHGIV